MTQELDLTPDPRILQMLGEIDLHQWRCIAELVDNGIDGLMHAAKSGNPIDTPEITVNIPTTSKGDARVSVKDNGPGMSIDVLENAVKAGWTSNNPLDSLGLFGMGFNIATARLGLVTEIWTTRAGDPEWYGVRIDLDALRTSQSFRVPRQTRPKPHHEDHSTEVIITKLKTDQRAYLARTGNQNTIKKHLARAYASVLQNSEAGRIRLKVNGTRIRPRRHCVWDVERTVELGDGTVVRAVENIDVKLAPRRFCTYCMRPLSAEDETCPTGSSNCNVQETERRVRGWVGLQRHLHKSDFGIDFVRNGRKIEIGSKDLFIWNGGDSSEVEYPIDDPRNRGRFVGEIHLDHCRVSYTKDRFERDDPSWAEMVRVVRGDGPLRPMAAKQSGFEGNASPLYKLFQAFRRSSPQGKNGLWSRVLVVRDNDRSEQMAEAFHLDNAEFLSDEPWWNLVVEQDREVLGGDDAAGGQGDPDVPEGFLDDDEDALDTGEDSGEDAPEEGSEPVVVDDEPERVLVHELSRKYVHPTYRVEFEVEAYEVQDSDPELTGSLPWCLKIDDVATRTYAYLFNPTHEVFRSTTLMPLDALLTELSVGTLEFLKNQVHDVTLAGILADYRRSYSSGTRLDPTEIIASASTTISDFARAIPSLLPDEGGQNIYDSLKVHDREQIAKKMAARGVTEIGNLIAQGRFVEYMDHHILRDVFSRNPSLFFDGNYWSDPFGGLDLGAQSVNDSARARLVARYDAYLEDAIWLADQSSNDLDRANRDAVVRATCALRLLRPDRED